jgi:hypothetical protein
MGRKQTARSSSTVDNKEALAVARASLFEEMIEALRIYLIE